MKRIFNQSKYGANLFIALAATIIFAVDVSSPLGIAMAVPYITVVLLSLLNRNSSTTIIWAILCTGLTLVGYYLSPVGTETWFAVFNRVITIYAIWAVTFIAIYITELTEKTIAKQSDEKVSELRRTLGQVAEHTKDSVIITNTKGEITWVNKAFTELSGYPLEEISGKKPGSFLQGSRSDISQVKMISEAIRNKIAIECELLNYHKNGTAYWVNIAITPVFDKAKLMHFTAVQRDITLQKKLQTDLAKQVEHANSETDTKTHLMHLISNELKGPVNDLNTLSKKIEESQNIEETKTLSKQLTLSSHLLQSTLNYVIQLTYLKVNDIAVRPKDHNLKEYVNKTTDELERLARGNGVKFNSNTVLSTDNNYQLDLELFDTVLYFFALTVTSQLRGGILNFDYSIDFKNRQEQLVVNFQSTDNGIGYRQMQNCPINCSELDKGIHVGFKVISKIIAKLNGKIDVTQTASGDSKVSIQLPIKQVLTEKAVSTAGSLSILIAEDNKINFVILKKLLNQLGYDNIDHAVDGMAAVLMALDKPYDLILMDHHMPKMTGLDATKSLLKQHKIDTIVVACTADTSNEVQQQFYDFGAKDVIYKPIRKESLTSIFDKHVLIKGKTQTSTQLTA